MTIERKYADRIDMTFKYTPAAGTNIAETFRKARKAQAEAAAKAEEVASERVQKVRTISTKGG